MRTSTRMTLAAGVATGLGAVPLGAVYVEWRWIWYAWAAVAAVVGGHLLARSLRLPAVLVPLAGALALLEYLTVAFASDRALLGIIPTPESLRVLGEGLRSGLDDVNVLAAPVPATAGLVVLTASSIGAIAILVDIVAVTLRRPAASGLALLALYAVPTAVAFDGVPWTLFVIGATGYLILLMVEGRDRLLRWGRPVGRRSDRPGDDDASLPFAGQRIGIAALALAVILPVMVPGLSANALYNLGRGAGEGDGTGTGTSQNPFTSLKGRLVDTKVTSLLKVEVNLEQPYYLRANVLEEYTGSGWRQKTRRNIPSDVVPGQLGLPDDQPPPQLSASRGYTAKITIDTYSDRFLPTFYLPEDVSGDVNGSWAYDRHGAVVYSRTSRANGSYTVTGTESVPSVASLNDAGDLASDEQVNLQEWLQVPLGMPAEVVQKVRDLTATKSTPYARARALNDYFRDGTNGFTYSLQTKEGNSGSDLVDFLRNKRGYCEQYASAMAIMLRLANVPARVVLGYTLGPKSTDGSYTVTNKDSHAWVEAYFSGVGWVMFDPTPLGEGRAVSLPWAPLPSSGPSPSSSVSGSLTATPSGVAPNRLPNEPTSAQDQARTNPLTNPKTLLVGLGGLAAIGLLIAPMLGRLVQRRRRLRIAGGPDADAAARAAWDEVLGTATDYGVPVPETETPRATARRLSRDLSMSTSAVAGLRLVALAEERARYAPEAGVDGDLPTAVRAVRRGLQEDADSRQRWRAVLLPASTLRAARRGSAARTATASSALNRLGENLRRPVTPRRGRRN